MLFAAVLLLVSSTPTASGPAPAPPAVTIVCKGEGDRRLGQPGPFADREAAFDDDVTLKLDGEGGARIHIPGPMIPSLHFGAADGWRPVRALHVDKAEITGTVSFNILDKAHFVIDMGLGVISLDDNLGRFVGRCEKVETQ
jgi:hypothetical protein